LFDLCRKHRFADQFAGKSGGAAVLTGRATQNQGVAAVLNDCLRFALSVGALDLGDRMEIEHTAATELAQARESVARSARVLRSACQ
jgi:hypothetical protein